MLHTLYSDNSAFESDINDAMFAAFGDEFVKLVFSPDAADQRIQFKVRWKSLENPVPASDLSDGTLRYLIPPGNSRESESAAVDRDRRAGNRTASANDGAISPNSPPKRRRRTRWFSQHIRRRFLDALNRFNPMTTVVEAHNSETQIKNVSPEILCSLVERATRSANCFARATLEAMS